ncbi:MAG: hypothetical protein KJ821_05250 [Actinobacteria bacterium]|nr:hypothetical protein [Actinomycetota bacterium]
MKYRKFVFFLLCLLFAGNTVSGSQICIKEEPKGNLPAYYTIYFKGVIEKGDHARLNMEINKIRDLNGVVYLFYLRSYGGDVIEAMKIGRLIRKNCFVTVSPHFVKSPYGGMVNIDLNWPEELKTGAEDANCTCNSSCFLLWAAGVNKSGNRIGIHRPYFSKDYFAGLTAIEAKNKYKKMSNEVKDYLLEMDVPKNIIEKMFQTTSSSIYFLDINTIDSMRWAPFFEEWVIANCDRPTEEETADKMELFRKSPESLSKAEDFYYRFLTEEYSKYLRCLIEQIRDAQSNIK